MFGNLGNSWTTGLSHFSDLSETFQKLRQDVEQNIESSLGIEGKAAGPRASIAGAPSDQPAGEGSIFQADDTAAHEAPSTSAAQPEVDAAPQPSLEPFQPAASGAASLAVDPSHEPQQQQQQQQMLDSPEPAPKAEGMMLDESASGWDPGPLSPSSEAEASYAGRQDDVQLLSVPPTDEHADGEDAVSLQQQSDSVQPAEASASAPEAAPQLRHSSQPDAEQQPPTDPVSEPATEEDGLASAIPSVQPHAEDDTPSLQHSPIELEAIPLQPEVLQQKAEATRVEPALQEAAAEQLPQAAQAPSDTQHDTSVEEASSQQQQEQQRQIPSEQVPIPSENGHVDAHGAVSDDGKDGPGSFAEAGRQPSEASLADSSASASEQHQDLDPSLPTENGVLHNHVDEAVHPEDAESLRKLVRQLRQTVSTREMQLEGQAREQSRLENVTHQLMARNEELAKQKAAISEEDFENMRREFQGRLETAERKVYALSKERDALRRGSDKLSSANDLLKEKDSIIQQVMEEGERLSKKQLAQESTIKKLRAQLKEADLARTDISTNLTIERNKIEAAQAGQQRAEMELKEAAHAHKAELEAEKAHFAGMLQKARAAQVEAEQKAAVSAKEGLQRKLREAEARVESLAETVEELRAGLGRQQAAADLREDMHAREISDLTRRNQAAEARHEELAAALPEATRPLVRQLEAMQAASQQQHSAWAAAEASLTSRAHDAEARAAAAAERERLATDRLQAANARAASSAASTEALRAEIATLTEEVDREAAARQAAEHALRKAEAALSQARADSAEVERAAELAESDWNRERTALQDLQLVSLQRAAAAEDRLKMHGQQLHTGVGFANPSAGARDGGGGNAGQNPPAMAGPGYRWVLQKEGEAEPASPSSQASGQSSQPFGHTTVSATGAAAGSYRGRFVQGAAGEVERLREAVRQREDQVASMQSQIGGLESTRDSLAEELVSASQAVEAGHAVQRQLDRLHVQHDQVKARLAAAEELLGEREERLAELSADLADVKLLYKDQIEFMVEQLAIAQTPPASPALLLPAKHTQEAEQTQHS